MSVGTNVAAIAASLLSRRAATGRSHGRKAVVRVSFRREPRRGERFARNLSPLRGLSSYSRKTPGSRPGLRSAAATRLYSDALRATSCTAVRSIPREGTIRPLRAGPRRLVICAYNRLELTDPNAHGTQTNADLSENSKKAEGVTCGTDGHARCQARAASGSNLLYL